MKNNSLKKLCVALGCVLIFSTSANAYDLSAVKNYLQSLSQSAASLKQSSDQVTSQLKTNAQNDAAGLTGSGGPGELGLPIVDPPIFNTTAGQNNVFLEPYMADIYWNRFWYGMKPTDLTAKPPIATKSEGKDGDEDVTVDRSGSAQYVRLKKIFNNNVDRYLINNINTGGNKDADGIAGPLLPRAANTATNANPMFKQTGEARQFTSPNYSKNKAVYADGMCQMISTGNGPIKFMPLSNGKNQIEGYTPQTPPADPALITRPEIPGDPLMKQAVQGDYEAILYPAHPFGPREDPDWKQRISPSIIEANEAGEHSGGGSGGFAINISFNADGTQNNPADQVEEKLYTYTWVCGMKQFPLAIPLPLNMFKIVGNKGSFKSAIEGMHIDFNSLNPQKKAWVNGFDYYKKPMEEKGGRILVSDIMITKLAVDADRNRNLKFAIPMPICYEVIKEVCEAATYDYAGVICPKIALETCEYNLCRWVILPPATPINRLKMGENLAPEGPGSFDGGGGNGAASGFQTVGMSAPSNPASSMGGKVSQKPTLESNRAGTNSICGPKTAIGSQLNEEGMSWYCANPTANFGYNMPPIYHIESGQPVSNTVIAQYGGIGKESMEKWETWRTVLVGVNTGLLPDASNGDKAIAYNMSGLVGGWPEFKQYYDDCAFIHKLNCVCNWEKTVAKGNMMGYALASIGSSVMLSNEQKLREKAFNAASPDGYLAPVRSPFSYAEDLTDQAQIPWDLPQSYDDRTVASVLRKPVGGGSTLWPGDVQGGEIQMKDAQAGDLVYLRQDEKSKTQYTNMRPDIVAKVKRVRDDKCLEIEVADYGSPFINTMGSGQLWGVARKITLCPNGSGTSKGLATTITGMPTEDGKPLCGPTLASSNCREKEPEAWKVYRPSNDHRGFTPKSGKQV